MKLIVLLIILAAFAAACSDRGTLSKDYLERKVTVGDKNYSFRVLLPKNHNPEKKIPVMLYLHGSGSRGDDNRAQIEGFNSAIEAVKDKINFIVVIPQCRQETFWSSTEMATYALAALDNSVKEFNGDENRLYLSGFSLGGYGTWQIAAAYPGKFAALAPVAGGIVGGRPVEPRDREVMIPEVLRMLDAQEPYKAVANVLSQTPVWVFHGAKDDAVPVEYSRKIVAIMKESGNSNVKYTEYENERHMIFGKSFSEPGFLEWLALQKK